MGCTTSVVLLEGLRSILERNCGYIKGAAELGALEEEEETLSLRGSQLWNPTTALKEWSGWRHERTISHRFAELQDSGVSVRCSESRIRGKCVFTDLLWAPAAGGYGAATQYDSSSGCDQPGIELIIIDKSLNYHFLLVRCSAAGSGQQRDQRAQAGEQHAGPAGKAPQREMVDRVSSAVQAPAEIEAEVKPKIIEPLDYENVLLRGRTQIISDVLREHAASFPPNDFQMYAPNKNKKESKPPRQGRTLFSTCRRLLRKELTHCLSREGCAGAISGCGLIEPDSEEVPTAVVRTYIIIHLELQLHQNYKSDWHVATTSTRSIRLDFRQLPKHGLAGIPKGGVSNPVLVYIYGH
ncbi:unnamed protein product, partial [Pleuronectes platessa]